MIFGYAAFLFIMGMLGAAGLIIARKPDAKELIGKFAPYQGWIGAVGVLGGVWEVIWVLGLMSWLGDGFSWMILWITYTATAVIKILLGFLLGIGVIKTFVKQEAAVEKMNAISAKLAPTRAPSASSPWAPRCGRSSRTSCSTGVVRPTL